MKAAIAQDHCKRLSGIIIRAAKILCADVALRAAKPLVVLAFPVVVTNVLQRSGFYACWQAHVVLS